MTRRRRLRYGEVVDRLGAAATASPPASGRAIANAERRRAAEMIESAGRVKPTVAAFGPAADPSAVTADEDLAGGD